MTIAPNSVVKSCRRCGKEFKEQLLRGVPSSSAAYTSHRYCPNCRASQQFAARKCDPRYVGVGGHGGYYDWTLNGRRAARRAAKGGAE